MGSTLQGRKLCLIYFLFYWVDREREGGGSNCNLKFWIVKRENMNESGPAVIEVVRIFSPNSVYSCLGPQVVHLWNLKGDYHVWSDARSNRHGAMVCRIVNWKGVNAYSVTSPLNIWTKFGVWLPRTLGGPPSIITSPTSFSQSRRSTDVTWRHTLGPRYTWRQKGYRESNENAYYRLNKGCQRDKFVIRSVTDVLQAQIGL